MENLVFRNYRSSLSKLVQRNQNRLTIGNWISKMVDKAPSPTTVSSLARVVLIGKKISDSPILQVDSMGMEKGKSVGNLEETMKSLNLGVKELREKIQVLENRFDLLSMFTIKVNHVTATTLHLLKVS